MIIQTICEALLYEPLTAPGYVYVVRDGDVIFYVGISRNPAFRLAQHLGIADGWNHTYQPEELVEVMERGPVNSAIIERLMPAQLGRCILENAPASLDWSFDIYEQEDAITVLEQTDYPLVRERIMKDGWYDWRNVVERELIKSLNPYLNDETSSLITSRRWGLHAGKPSSVTAPVSCSEVGQFGRPISINLRKGQQKTPDS